MPTPSELQNQRPRRSIFGNYRPVPDAAPAPPDSVTGPATTGHHPECSGAVSSGASATALARSFIYRYLAKAFEDFEPEGWNWLTNPEVLGSLRVAAGLAWVDQAKVDFGAAMAALVTEFTPQAGADFAQDYIACFGHTVRGDCPMNEIEYGDIKADPLFQPHRLADLGAFYAAFGMEMTPDAAERQDHISIELEFLSVLSAKEVYAHQDPARGEMAALLRDAQKKFLREHLARWTPAFTRRLASMAGSGSLRALAAFARDYVALECARFEVTPGSEDLLLRPIDEDGEKLCASCGLNSPLPGALNTAAME